MAQNFEISLPDPLVDILRIENEEVPRKVLEGFVAQLFRTGQISHYQVGQFLGLDRWETDGFLKEAQAYPPEAADQFLQDFETVRKIAKK